MILHKTALLALVLVPICLAQVENPNDRIRKLRFRRPNSPRVVGIEDEDGAGQGPPIPLRAAGVPVDQLINRQQQEANTAQLLQAALQEEEQDLQQVRPRPHNRPRPGRPQQTTDALESLLATAGAAQPRDQEPQIEEEPLEPVTRPAQRRPAGRTRAPPGVPRRRRPRPRPVNEEGEEAEKGARRPNRPEAQAVGTVERYSHENEDGSFTFGYVAEDGSFREETRGVDCITRGKYGYIDPDGKRREFTYVSGLPCEIGEEGAEEDENDLQTIDDPIDPSERFRTAAAVQLSEDEIPQAARPRQRVRTQEAPIPGAQRTRVRDPAVRNRRPQAPAGGALDNLFQIADDQPTLSPTPAPARGRPVRPRPASRPGSFNFDQEVQDFDRPALKFEEEDRKQEGAPKPVGPNFSSELVFNPETGTFQTELRQNIGGQGEVRISNQNAPGVRRPTPTAAGTPRPNTFSPTPVPARPVRPQPTQAAQRPFTAFAQSPRPAQPTGGSIQFEPLSFPDPSSVRTPAPAPSPRPTPASPQPRPQPTPAALAPRPPTPTAARPPSPTPGNSFFFQPFGTTAGSPRPAAPTPAGARPQPVAPTPVAPRGPPTPTQQVIPAGTFTLGPRPTAAQPPRPAPTQARPPQPQPPRPVPNQARPPFTQPQVQFGFSPIQQQQQQNRPAPFTAFSSGTPPQLRGAAPPPNSFQPRPPQPQPFQPQQFQQPRPTQLGVPPQLQGAPRPPQGAPRPPQGVPPQGRFQPFGRPPPGAPSQPFTVFNPANLRGARFF